MKRIEYIEKTNTLIGNIRRELIDKETGEIIEVDQITKKVYGQKNFWKLYLNDFLHVLGGIENKQVAILKYILDNTHPIMSANVHLDEETPHMHLVFIPVVHTKDKNGNGIDKIACSEFWKGKDSYRQLQDAFYNHTIEKGFKLERGQANNSEHVSIETLKKLTGFNEIDNFVKADFPVPLEIGTVPDIIDSKYAKEQIIEPFKEKNLKLIEQNIYLKRNLSTITEHIKLLADCEKDNKKLIKENRKLKRENKKLLKDIDLYDRLLTTLKNTVNKFISWVSSTFKITEKSIIDTFEKETNTFLNPMEQLLEEDENLMKDLEQEYDKIL